MKFNIHLKLLLNLPLLMVVACESVDSDDIRTSGIYASINVEANGNGNTLVKTRLTVGGVLSNTDLELEQGDQLVASASGGASFVMREDKEFLGGVEYKATFLFDTENTRFNVEFNRPSGVSAPDSFVIMPAPVSLVTPTVGQTFKRSENISISWTPVSNNMSKIKVYSSRASCTDANGQIITQSLNSNSVQFEFDPGGVTRVASSYIAARALSDPAASCVVSLRIVRTQKGVIDRAFGEGGRISANRSDTVDIRVVP